MQTRVMNGFELALFEDSREPYIPDVELGKRLGLSRHRDLRRLIRRWYDSGHLTDTRCVRRSQCEDRNSRHGGANSPHGGVNTGSAPYRAARRPGRPAEEEYFLGEADTLFIVTKSETPLATQITRQIIDVYMAWRRGPLAQPKNDPAIAQALTAIYEEVKAVRVLTTHVARAVGVLLPESICREAGNRRRSHSKLDTVPGIRLHVHHLFELDKQYAEIQESLWKTFHFKISDSALSRAYQRWTIRTGRTLNRTSLPV